MHKTVLRYILFLILMPDCFAAGAIQTIPIYKIGSPTFVHLKYDGTDKMWDAGFNIARDGKLQISNSAIFVLYFEESKVEFRKGLLTQIKYDALKKDPISITVKLDNLYVFTSPGNYTLEWGSKNSLTHKYNFIVR